MKSTTTLTLLIAPLTLACSQLDSHSESLETLIATERAFSAASVANGTRAAFLEFLSDSGIIFSPTPVNGKAVLRERAESESRLSWRPEFADVSAAGDLGYTTGPWELRQDRDSDPSAWGHYVTVWERTEDGTWKFAIDGGTLHGDPATSDSSVTSPAGDGTPPSSQTSSTDLSAELAHLMEVDRNFSRLAAETDVAEALRAVAALETRVYRDSVLPVLGKDQGHAFIVSGGYNHVTWDPMASVVSGSRDLGFTYGRAYVGAIEDPARVSDTANFLHIWKRSPGSDWKLVLDLLTPSPPVQNKPN